MYHPELFDSLTMLSITTLSHVVLPLSSFLIVAAASTMLREDGAVVQSLETRLAIVCTECAAQNTGTPTLLLEYK